MNLLINEWVYYSAFVFLFCIRLFILDSGRALHPAPSTQHPAPEPEGAGMQSTSQIKFVGNHHLKKKKQRKPRGIIISLLFHVIYHL